MPLQIVQGDITRVPCDAIVNASNGIGFMGGKAGMKRRLAGVAESIHYATQGQVEAAAKAVCRAHHPFGFGPGQVFVTPAFHLNCHYILHAVTMRFPGTRSSLKTVKKLLPKILDQARSLGITGIALPLLGAGTGHVSEKRLLALYHQVFDSVEDLDICVYIYRK